MGAGGLEPPEPVRATDLQSVAIAAMRRSLANFNLIYISRLYLFFPDQSYTLIFLRSCL